MRFPLTDKLLREAEAFALRSSCVHCYFYVADEKRCGLDWPTGEQARWPLDATTADGKAPTTVDFCKEFELA